MKDKRYTEDILLILESSDEFQDISNDMYRESFKASFKISRNKIIQFQKRSEDDDLEDIQEYIHLRQKDLEIEIKNSDIMKSRFGGIYCLMDI